MHVHFTPTSASSLNLAEVWFGIIERQAAPPRHIPQPHGPQRQDPHVHHWLERRCHPFVWTTTTDDILAKANRQNTLATIR